MRQKASSPRRIFVMGLGFIGFYALAADGNSVALAQELAMDCTVSSATGPKDSKFQPGVVLDVRYNSEDKTVQVDAERWRDGRTERAVLASQSTGTRHEFETAEEVQISSARIYANKETFGVEDDKRDEIIDWVRIEISRPTGDFSYKYSGVLFRGPSNPGTDSWAVAGKCALSTVARPKS